MNKITILKISLLILIGLLAKKTYSQENHDHHEHHKFELGVANSFVYFVKEKETAYSLHFHIVRNISDTKFGYGLAFERIFDEHKHNTIGLVGSYSPTEALHLSVGPGVTFEDQHSSDMKFAFHAESTYIFNLDNFHIGPMIEFAIDPEDYHFSLGLHIGFGF